MILPLRPLPFVMALVVWQFGGGAGTAAAGADEWPEDTNVFKTLTPQQAAVLAKHVLPKDVEIQGRDGTWTTMRGCLPLNGLKSLTAETAAELAGHFRSYQLDGLETLDADTARALTRKGSPRLSLGVLTTLNVETAAALEGCQSLYLDGLTQLDPHTAQALRAIKAYEYSLDGLTTINAATARALVAFDEHGSGPLSLDGLTSLDAATAQALASGQSHWLSLDGLTSLDVGAAAQFMGYSHSLSLGGLQTLEADVATALARRLEGGGELRLVGLRTLDAATARALATFPGRLLQLDGLTMLDADTAAALARFPGKVLQLNGLTMLDADTAQALADFQGQELSLDGVQALDADTAGQIARYRGELGLDGLTELDAGVAAGLAGAGPGEISRQLSLANVQTLSPEAARGLANYAGSRLNLHRLRAIDVELARIIGTFKAESVHLGGAIDDVEVIVTLAAGKPRFDSTELFAKLKTLDPKAAALLAEHREEHLFLDNLTGLDPATARALVAFAGTRLRLNGLTRLDADTAGALAGFRGKDLGVCVPTLDPEAARALAGFRGPDLSVNVSRLDVETARALVASPRRELFVGLRSLDAEVFAVLATFGGARLALSCPPTLGAATIRAIASSRSRAFNGLSDVAYQLEAVDAAAAAALAEAEGWDGSLPGITAFEGPDSVAVATALATREGPLVMLKLRRISPNTLTALLAKRDVEIPFLDGLEMIPEPDGTPSDDIRVPDGFHSLQQRQHAQRQLEARWKR